MMHNHVDLAMPKLGDTVLEGTVLEWLVAEGDAVAEGQALAEITTDKVTTEYPSPVAGTVVAYLVDAGAVVPIGTPMVRVATADTPGGPPDATTPSPAATAEPSEPAAKPIVESDRARVTTAPRATGAARAAAAAMGVDVAELAGSGRHGRVVEADVSAAASRIAPAMTIRSLAPAASQKDAIRRAMARAMEASWEQADHAVAHALIDVHDMLRARAQLRDDFRRRRGIDLTALPYWVNALARLLGAPGDIGVAVALADGALLVPVVRDAGVDLETCAVSVDHAITQARAGKVPRELSGGGQATVTNIGVFGARFSQPILSPGQPLIIGLGAADRRLVPCTTGIAVRTIQPVSLVYDRQVFDEVRAAALLADLQANLVDLVDT